MGVTVNSFQELTDYLSERFEAIDQRFIAIDGKFEAMNQRFNAMDQRFGNLEKIVADLPTKSYIDQRFIEAEVNLTKTLKPIEYKTNRLVEMLKVDGAISDAHHNELKGMPVLN